MWLLAEGLVGSPSTKNVITPLVNVNLLGKEKVRQVYDKCTTYVVRYLSPSNLE